MDNKRLFVGLILLGLSCFIGAFAQAQCINCGIVPSSGPGSGTVTAVTGAAPITSTGGTTPAIGLEIPSSVSAQTSAAVTLDLSVNRGANYLLSAAGPQLTTITLTNPADGVSYPFTICNNSTGTNTVAFAFAGSFDYAKTGGVFPTLNPAVGGCSYYEYYYTATQQLTTFHLLNNTPVLPDIVLTNDAAGTILYGLVKQTGSTTVTSTAITDTDRILGVCESGCTTSGPALIQTSGIAWVNFDGTIVNNDWVQNSTSVASDAHDAGATRPTTTEPLGQVVSAGTSGVGRYQINLAISAPGLPNPTATTIGGVESFAAVTHQYLNQISTSGVPSAAQPVCADLSDSTTYCNTNPASPPAQGGTTPAAGTFTNVNAVTNLGAIGSGGTATCAMSGFSVCKFSVGAGNITLAKPTGGVIDQLYWLDITSTSTSKVISPAAGWEVIDENTTLLTAWPAFVSGASGGNIWIPFVFNGTNYDIPILPYVSTRTLSANIANIYGNVSVSNGGLINSTGGTAPTLTAGCNGAGSAVAAGSTDNRGQITTQTAAATTCTMTFNHTWPQAPFCLAADSEAQITPAAYSVGATSTTTVVFDFVSAANDKFNYHCF